MNRYQVFVLQTDEETGRQRWQYHFGVPRTKTLRGMHKQTRNRADRNAYVKWRVDDTHTGKAYYHV